MTKVILITGASTGIGKETALLFQSKNWRVAATMRTPEKAEDLQRIADLECFRLDVTDVESIRGTIAAVLEKFSRIAAVVNNAGYGLVGPFESASDEQIRRQFETNVFGLMNVTREILPYFREQKRGTLINGASVGGRITFPLYSLYHSTKWAVEGFSESLRYELEEFNIKVKIVEPDRSRPISMTARSIWRERTHSPFMTGSSTASCRICVKPEKPRRTDASSPKPFGMRRRTARQGFVTASIRGEFLAARRFLPDSAFFKLIKSALIK